MWGQRRLNYVVVQIPAEKFAQELSINLVYKDLDQGGSLGLNFSR
jgi:hypothetical protein